LIVNNQKQKGLDLINQNLNVTRNNIIDYKVKMIRFD